MYCLISNSGVSVVMACVVGKNANGRAVIPPIMK